MDVQIIHQSSQGERGLNKDIAHQADSRHLSFLTPICSLGSLDSLSPQELYTPALTELLTFGAWLMDPSMQKEILAGPQPWFASSLFVGLP